MAQSVWQSTVDMIQSATNNFGNSVAVTMTNGANGFTGIFSGAGTGTPTITTNVSSWTNNNAFTGSQLTEAASGTHSGDIFTLLSGSTDVRGRIEIQTTSGSTIAAYASFLTLNLSSNYPAIAYYITSATTYSNVTGLSAPPVAADATTNAVLFRMTGGAFPASSAMVFTYWRIQ